MTLFDVTAKTVLITGGSRGIGAMLAHGFVSHGARVYLAGRDQDALHDTVAALAPLGHVVGIQADVSTPEGVNALAEQFGTHESVLNVLVNNAGTTWGAPFDSYPPEAFTKVLNVNVAAPFWLTQALAPALRRAASATDPARVIMIGSIDGIRLPDFDSFAYSASKAAIHQLTRHVAKTLAHDQVTVNAIAPGYFPSKMTAFMFDDEPQLAAKIPLQRTGERDDLAGVAILLASRAGAYITGAVIPVDGGLATLL
jgi:NAD(P)-dependent dehydrogenase (short-subunit alcohol dehydrogenase family)